MVLDVFKYFYTTVDSANKTIIARAKSIVKNANVITDTQKVKAVHDWVAANITYPNSKSDFVRGSEPASEVLAKRMAECQGYSYLSVALLRSLNIPCRVIIAHAEGSRTLPQTHQDFRLRYKEYLKSKDYLRASLKTHNLWKKKHREIGIIEE